MSASQWQAQSCTCASSMLDVYVRLDAETTARLIMLDRIIPLVDSAFDSCTACVACPHCSTHAFPLSVLSALVCHLTRAVDSCCRRTVFPRNMRRAGCPVSLDNYRLKALEPEQLATTLLRSRLTKLIDSVLAPMRAAVGVMLGDDRDGTAPGPSTLRACQRALNDTADALGCLIALLDELLLEDAKSTNPSIASGQVI